MKFGMRECRECFNRSGQATGRNQSVFSDFRVTTGVPCLAFNRDFEAETTSEAHSHIVVAALRHDGVIRMNHVFVNELIGSFA